MRLTNNAGLPAPLVEAIANDSYTRGDADISVTSLISPPRQVALLRAHGDELEEDASDRVFSLLGQAIHTIMERASNTGLAEERLYADVGGWRISGQIDRLDGTTIGDFKTASVNELAYGVKAERELQLNCYAHLARLNGYTVERVEAIFILRDWSKVRAAKDPSYPQKQVAIVELPLWSHEKAQAYIEQRVFVHQLARSIYEREQPQQDGLPDCSAEERWAKPDVYAVMKTGRKSAVKLCDWEAEAQAYVNEWGADKHYIQHRPGESLRCTFYCGAAAVCEQFKAMQGVPAEEAFE